MKQNGFFATYVYPFLAAFLLCGAGGLFFNSRFGMRMNEFLLLVVIALFILIVQLFDLFKRRVWVSLLFGAFLLAAVGLLCHAIFSSYDEMLRIGGGVSSVRYGLFSWWENYNPTTERGYDFDYALLTVSIYVLVAGLGSYFIQKGFTARVLSAIGLIAGIVVLISYETEIPWLALVFVFMYLFSVLIELYFRSIRRKTEQKRLGTTIAAFLLPVTLVTSLVISWLPLNEDPIDWSFITEPLQNITLWSGNLIQWGYGPGGTPDSGFSVGYSDANGDLGGDLVQKTGTALTLRFDTLPRAGVYLTGSTSDTYTGRRWEDRAEDFYGVDGTYIESAFDGLELLYALSRVEAPDEEINNFMYRNSITITYQNVWTPSVFLPQKVITTIERANNLPVTYQSSGLGTFFDEPRKDASYSVDYLEIDYNSQEYNMLIDSNSDYIYHNTPLTEPEFWLHKLAGRIDTNGTVVKTPFGQYSVARAEWIRDTYLQLPESLPARVSELAHTITDEYDNDYDKLKAIETYLSTNYEYTTTPGDVPEGYDFVDYFLFEKQEGYCTYFATSMTVLARCVDIPTRYVQGYSASCDTTNDEHEYEVLHEEAHAWPEAYIEGIGWIAFEPTAPMQGNRYPNWGSSQWQNEQPTQPEQPNNPGGDNSQNENSQPDVLPEEREGQVTAIVITVLSFLALLILAAVFIPVFLRHRRKMKYKSVPVEEKIKVDFKDILLLLEACSYKLNPGETLSAYNERIAASFRGSHKLFARAEKIYSRLYYSNSTATQEEYELVHFTRETILRETRDQISTLQFLRVRSKLQKF